MLVSKRKKIGAITVLLIISFAYLCHHQNQKCSALKKPADQLEVLRSLPYVSSTNEKIENTISGVTAYNSEKAFNGYNLYTDYSRRAYLIDMHGKIAHEWLFPFEGRWEHLVLLKNGQIIAICVGKCIIKLNIDSEVLWAYTLNVNHDIVMPAENTFIVPFSENSILYNSRRVHFDSLLWFSENGEIVEKWSTFKNLGKLKKLHSKTLLDERAYVKATGIARIDRRIEKALDDIRALYLSIENLIKGEVIHSKLDPFEYAREEDISKLKMRKVEFRTGITKLIRRSLGIATYYEYYHLNSIHLVPDTQLGRKDDRFKKGNYIICLRNVSLIAILDRESKEIVWSWGAKELDWPHAPSMTYEGTILVFDNGTHRKYSRVLEINPLTGKIVWEYKTNPPQSFFSDCWGYCQRLPNGNTLICDSGKGRVFEITKENELVWEFFNPFAENGNRKKIYRMIRIPKEYAKECLGLSD